MELDAADLVRHSANRTVRTKGEKWDALCASMREHGQLQPLLVRELGECTDGTFSYEIIAGERRWRAARAVGQDRVKCLVRELTDREALEIILIENLEREDLDAVEEARGVKALIEQAGMAPGEVAARLSRSLEWVTTRQGLLGLPEEVLTAVRRPVQDERHLGLGTVQLILGLPEEDRPRAVQLVLHPEFQVQPLTRAQAADVIKRTIVMPRAEKVAWEGGREKFAKAWKTRLAKLLPKAMREDLVVRAPGWEECQGLSAGREAEEVLPLAEVLPEAPVPLTWLALAVRHGLTVFVVPAENEMSSKAVVDARVLRSAEAALGERPAAESWKPWLSTGRTSNIERPTSNIEGKNEEQIRRAKAAVEGEPEHLEMTEAGDQPMEVESLGTLVQPWTIDGGPVTGLRMWAEGEMKNQAAQQGEIRRPDWPLPEWASWLPLPQVVEVCQWVEGLKR
jgi:ParB/RepB/Spo0J family partition protein